ncbi:MAG: hypothetical protein WC635_12150 [Bacteriovorax sp.]|jgi:hypothetical protein
MVKNIITGLICLSIGCFSSLHANEGSSKEEFIRKMNEELTLKASVDRASQSLSPQKLEAGTGLQPECETSGTPPPPIVNRFDRIKTEIHSYCTKIKRIASITSCETLVNDVFEVGSPSCKTGDAGSAASSCTMGMNYLVAKFQGADKEKYSAAIIKLQAIQKEILDGKRQLTSQSLFPLMLEATNGDKEMAINLFSMENLGVAGLSSFINQVKGFPSESMNVIKNWSKQGGIFKSITNKFPLKKLRNVPAESISKVASGKEYHFWARAMLAAGMAKKGYSQLVSRSIATASSIVYEFYFDWKEHVQGGVPFKRRLSNALSDVLLSDEGSKLGSSL